MHAKLMYGYHLIFSLPLIKFSTITLKYIKKTLANNILLI